MARNLNAKHRLCRRVGEKLCGLDKCPAVRRPYPPGVHGPTSRRRLTGYGIQLLEKQKAKTVYGILERQFSRYVFAAGKSKGNTSEMLVRTLELRLDNAVYRLGFARTRSGARQMVGHGHFTVNGRKVTVPSIQLRSGDVIGIRPESKGRKFFEGIEEKLSQIELPPWITFDASSMTAKVIGMPTIADAKPLFDPKAIVEFYSR